MPETPIDKATKAARKLPPGVWFLAISAAAGIVLFIWRRQKAADEAAAAEAELAAEQAPGDPTPGDGPASLVSAGPLGAPSVLQLPATGGGNPPPPPPQVPIVEPPAPVEPPPPNQVLVNRQYDESTGSVSAPPAYSGGVVGLGHPVTLRGKTFKGATGYKRENVPGGRFARYVIEYGHNRREEWHYYDDQHKWVRSR